MKKYSLIALYSFFLLCSCKKNDLFIIYPPTGNTGNNILEKDKYEYIGYVFSLKTEKHKRKDLKVIISVVPEDLGKGETSSTAHFYYEINTHKNWIVSTFDFNTNSQVYTVEKRKEDADAHMLFEEGDYTIDYYEDKASSPTYSKTITVKKE